MLVLNGQDYTELARALAKVAHARQFRKGSGEPYFNHVQRVANSVNGWKARTVAYLHDVIEDTEVTSGALLLVGFPLEIVDAVLLLSRRQEETYKQFIQRTIDSGNRLVWEVKQADLADNLRDIDVVPGGSTSLRRRYVVPHAQLTELLRGGQTS